MLGPVFRAHDDERERLVAVKVFRLDLTPELADDVGDDLQALVSHWPSAMPGLVRPVRAGVDHATPWLAQEFAPGEGLDAILRRRTRPSIDEVVALVGLIADALDAAAADGWTHGALHPRDILVTQDLDGIAITGVGIAHVIERAGFRAPRRRPYVAPERVAGHAWDARADLYSLAVITLELIGTRRASSGGHLPVPTVLEEAGLDIELWSKALTRALAEDPAQRFATTREFADALEAACSSEPLAPRLPLEDPDEAADAAADARPLPVDPVPGSRAGGGRDVQAPSLLADAFDEPGISLGLAADQGVPPVRGSAITGFEDPVREDLEVDRPAGSSWQVGEHLPAAVLPPVAAGAPRPYGLLAATLCLGLFIGFLSGAWFMRGASFGERAQTSAPAAAPMERATVSDDEVVVNDVLPGAGDAGGAATPVTRPAPPPAPAPTAAPSAPARVPPSTTPADRTPGVVRITSTPTGARVTLDGRARGTTPLVVRDLALGTYRLDVSRDGYQAHSERVTLSSRRPESAVAVTLARNATPRSTPARPAAAPAASQRTGTLEVATRPTGARVLIDGRAVGSSPVTVPGLTPGTHQIRLELPGHRPWTTAVEVTPSQTRRVSASLEPTGPR